MRDSNKKRIHCKQDIEFGGTPDVHHDKRKLTVYPDSLSMDKLAIDNLELKMKSEAVKSKATDVSAAWVEYPWRWEMVSKEQGENEL